MISTEEEFTHCAHLVDAIERIVPLSTPVRQAFLAVPRRTFVPSYYIQHGRQLKWTRQDAGEGVYEDKALVTQLDSMGMPSSSSTMPSVMAVMLEALDVQSGQRILEIGTGTGYNAALLSYLVGDPSLVTSIEIDDQLAEQAIQALELAGCTGMAVHVGNGLKGYKPNAPYDRIIATGSFPNVPCSWLDQLAPGGVLVGNLIGNLSSVLLRLVKYENGAADGTFLAVSGVRFIKLHSLEPSHSQAIDWNLYDALPIVEHDRIDFDLSTLLQDTTFLFFLQWEFPSFHLHLRHNGGPADQRSSYDNCLVDESMHTCMVVQPADRPGAWVVQVRGNTPLWRRMIASYQRWEQLQRPPLNAYRMEIDVSGQQSILLKEAPQILRWVITDM
jgi:protein-L-isoaspartate(D-aspartate) O-methyltransferase